MEVFEEILDDCLQQLASGTASLEECLKQHPAEAAELRPLLLAATKLEHARGSKVQPTPAYKRDARAELIRHMKANPRQPATRPGITSQPFWRVAFSVMALVIALLISGTAYAQGAVPGDSFYRWKISSERAWRVISQDRLEIDLILADRRVHEYMLVSGDPDRSTRALEGYGEVLVRLKSETDEQTRGRIVPILKKHASSLKDSGITIPELDDYLIVEGENGGTKSPLPPGTKTDPPTPLKDTVIPPPPK